MLRIDNLSYRAGARLLLDGASASVHVGHRVGLVGRNGSGKTTLLKLITGQLEPEQGRIEVPPAWRIGVTRQEAPEGPRSLIDTVLAADTELADLTREAETATDPHRIADIHARLQEKQAHAAPSRAARILAGLGFSEADQQRPCAEFSGGWRMRVALAALLFTQPDLLLLDEPTNHLDLEATLWLEEYLRHYPGTLIIVSHDRELLDRAVTEILHLSGAALTLYQGGYSRFEKTLRAKAEQSEKARARQDAERARIQAFVDRFRYKASKARQAQSRLKMLSKMEPVVGPADESTVRFDFPDPDPLPPPLFNADRVALGYDGTPVLRDLSFRIDPEDRVALLGPNGNGKSTLIKLLAGRLQPLSGETSKARKLKVGYFAQHQTDELDIEATPFIELSRRRPRDTPVVVRGQLGRFGFSQALADARIATLSGGEKARLLFALMTADKPHILLLDEPTNHLDVASREALVQALNAYPGAVILVSHDPHVLELTADRLWLVADGTVSPFDGDLADYRSRIERKGGNGGGARATADSAAKPGGAAERKQERRQAAARREALAPLRKRLAAAERTVDRLHAEQEKLSREMADPSLYEGDPARLIDLRKKLGQVEKDLAQAEEAWLALHEEVEQAATEPAA